MGVFFNAERVNTDEVYKKHLKRYKKDYKPYITESEMNDYWRLY